MADFLLVFFSFFLFGLHMGLAFFYIGVLHIIQGKKREGKIIGIYISPV